ncbi:hypothetical protein NQ317_006159 [Molorchus minor]|uniref:Uncharacterized protein n=1 Tax=Molorchus minor TaxID=1323400 RepID=A0ABQ9J9T6_9CUCU|nr:hypothetical protein NQ317_006159 [Molorchus minor]
MNGEKNMPMMKSYNVENGLKKPIVTPTKVIWSLGHATSYSGKITGSSSEVALCSPSVSQGIMRDLTQGTFKFIEESLNQSCGMVKPVLEHLKLDVEPGEHGRG